MARVIYLVQDLLFVSKIRETARQLGIEAEAARDVAGLTARAEGAGLVVVDLRRPDALAALDALRAREATRELPTVGFVDHEQVEAFEAARSRGCRAFAKGKFTSALPELLAAL